ncbi:hypothetical protein DOE51_09935 [Bdellovibrio sp. NC01]|nr:hypothetical protein DOE51_09935 [Bdellovibrio sp. NC01]
MNFFLSLIISFSFAQAFAQEKTSAILYDLKSNQTKKLFTLTIETTDAADGTHSKTSYQDLNGKVVVQETGLAQGDELKDYTLERPQTEEKGHIFTRDGKVYFEYEGPGGKKKSANEKIDGQILTPANFTAFVRKNWDSFNAGKAIPVRYAVWDRQETVGFTLTKVGDAEIKGQKAIELRMKPTSFVIAAIVDPIHLWYRVSDKKLMIMKGRVQPRQDVDGKLKQLDAETVYTLD